MVIFGDKKTKKVESEQTVGVDTMQPNNTVGMVIKTMAYMICPQPNLFPHHSPRFSLATQICLFYPELTKLISTSGPYCSLRLEFSFFPFIIWIFAQKPIPQRSLPLSFHQYCHRTLSLPNAPVTVTVPVFIFFVRLAFNGEIAICFLLAYFLSFHCYRSLLRAGTLPVSLTAFTNAQKSRSDSSQSIHIQ